MISFVNIALVILIAVVLPYFLGKLVCIICGDETESISKDVAYGFMLMCVLFLILAIPMILLRVSFHVLVYVWTAAAVALCIVSLFFIVRNKEHRMMITGLRDLKKGMLNDRFACCVWILAVFIIAFEAGLLTFKMHVDSDDARFIAEAMEAVENDTMLLHHPITGQYFGVATGEQRKDITAPYPVFIGLFGSLTGIHPAICAHTIFPLLYILLSYLVFGLIGDWVFDGDIRNRGLFMLFLSLIHLFSFETIFAAGYTLLTIIWQGRSVAAMIMLPLLWYVLLRISCKERIMAGDYVMMSLATLANAMLSNMGALFAFLMSLSYMAVIIIRRRSLKIMLFSGLSMLPVGTVIILGRLFSNTDILYRGTEIVRII